MPFEQRGAAAKRIAVIGGGISGMGAAHFLSRSHQVTLFEADRRLGGHARTVMAGKNGDQPVDTGFIVFNYANYPHMARLYEELGVPVIKSNMSFGASLQGGKIEYALASLSALFAQKRNAFNPAYLRMIRDIFRFNARAVETANRPDMTTREFLEKLGTGPWFRDYYLLPLSGAIWSTPTQGILDFPAQAMVTFFKNHALLGATGQHQWYTVDGGSVEYVRRLHSALDRAGVDIRLGTGIEQVTRLPGGAMIKAKGSEAELFDEVIFATHADDTLRLLGDATAAERSALSAVQYQPNEAVLHADTTLMPRHRQCWSSWVYTEAAEKQTDRIDLTYWMNSLQPIPQDDPHFVTLNATRPINPDLIYDTVTFRHPVYTLEALAAQDTIRAINGTSGTWFCGAWMKNGFHEDGLSSAIDVVEAMAKRDAGLLVAAE